VIQYLELSTDINVISPDNSSRPQTFQLRFENEGRIAENGAEVVSVSTQTDFKRIVMLELQPEYAGMHVPLSFVQKDNVCTLLDNYPLGEIGNGYVVRAWFEPASRSSRKNMPIPDENKIVVPYTRTFTNKEYERIKLGVTPIVMEDRWFAYFENDCLYWHSSWTGHGILEVYIESTSTGASVTKVIATNGPVIKGNPDFVYILDDLLNNLCLEVDKTFDI